MFIKYSPFKDSMLTEADSRTLLKWSTELDKLPDEAILHSVMALISNQSHVYGEISSNLFDILELIKGAYPSTPKDDLTRIASYAEALRGTNFNANNALNIFTSSLPEYEKFLTEHFPNRKPTKVIINAFKMVVLEKAAEWLSSERKRISMCVKLDEDKYSLVAVGPFEVLSVLLAGIGFSFINIVLGCISALILAVCYAINFFIEYKKIHMKLEGEIELEAAMVKGGRQVSISQLLSSSSYPKNHMLFESLPEAVMDTLLSEDDTYTSKNLNTFLHAIVTNCSHEHDTTEPYELRNVTRSFNRPRLYGASPKSLHERMTRTLL